jgi:hypothetical protein
MLLGKVIQSNDHLDYLCQIYRGDEIEQPPEPLDFGVGQFVAIELPGGSRMVGVIYNTQLYNPDFGRLGPRLSPQNDLEIFSPDFLEERAMLVSIAALGTLNEQAQASQTPPIMTPEPDALVHRLDDPEIRQFHLVEERFQLAYAPRLLGNGHRSIPELLLTIIDRLRELFPDQAGLLALLQDDLLWRARVSPIGGEA